MTVLGDLWNMVKDSNEWQTMAEAARKVPDLEKRVASLEQRLKKSAGEYVCDHCGGPELTRTGSRPDPTFGDMGIKQALFKCGQCGKESAFTQK